MRTSNRSDFRHWSRRASATNRTAVYGPVRTVVWQGSAGNRCPYADQRPLSYVKLKGVLDRYNYHRPPYEVLQGFSTHE